MKVNEIIEQGANIGASDIHICVGKAIQFRVHGALQSFGQEEITGEEVKRLVQDLAGEELFQEAEKNMSVDFSKTVGGVRIRSNVFKDKGNYACAIRIVMSQVASCESLGVPESIMKIKDKSKGLLLVTGPTSHGKSTTLAALINEINESQSKHIITLEDPIEYVHEHKMSLINQREIGIDAVSFPSGLRDALRQDPDLILVGEMRDCETISTALTAAETGHLVFATLHTMDCAGTVSRVVDVFPAEQQAQIRVMLADVIEGIVSQRLIPLKDGRRCAVHEVMIATPAIRSLIRENKQSQLYSQIQISQRDGMQTLDESLLRLYMTGMAEASVLLEHAHDVVWLERKMKATGAKS